MHFMRASTGVSTFGMAFAAARVLLLGEGGSRTE
jgi:hypothetical protein